MVDPTVWYDQQYKKPVQVEHIYLADKLSKQVTGRPAESPGKERKRKEKKRKENKTVKKRKEKKRKEKKRKEMKTKETNRKP